MVGTAPGSMTLRVAEVFGHGTSTDTIVKYVRENVKV